MNLVMYDSNIIIDILHKKAEPEDEDVCICGIIKAELLRGAVSQKNYEALKQMTADLYYLSFDEAQWESVGRRLYLLRTHGITVPMNDVIIYEICASQAVSLRTRDRHFQMIDNIFHEVDLR